MVPANSPSAVVTDRGPSIQTPSVLVLAQESDNSTQDETWRHRGAGEGEIVGSAPHQPAPAADERFTNGILLTPSRRGVWRISDDESHEASHIKIRALVFEARLSLAAFGKLLRNLSGATKHREARQAVKEMILETRTSYDTMVDTIAPLYAITTARQLKDRFPQFFTGFQSMYMKNLGEVRTHCHKVILKLNELESKKAWLTRVPGGRARFERLKSFTTDWAGNDDNLERMMNRLLWGLNYIFTDLNNKASQSPATALKALRLFLGPMQRDFLDLKGQLDELTVLGDAL